MKKRLVKKWMKRYIVPLISALPTTDSGVVEEVLGDWVYIHNNNYSIKNGYLIPEGHIVPPGGTLRHKLIRTGEAIKTILANHQKVYLRNVRITKNRTYVRLITDKVTP